jgi:hypothetical protein
MICSDTGTKQVLDSISSVGARTGNRRIKHTFVNVNAAKTPTLTYTSLSSGRHGDRMMSLSRMCFAFIVVVSLVTMATPNAKASTVYSYTGNPFNTFNGLAFSGRDSVTGEFTVASALGDNFSGTVLPSQFSFSNGLFSITNFNLPSSVFDIQTSNTGEIIGWSISLSIAQGGIGASILMSNLGDHGSIIGPTTFSSGGNSGNPGAWSSPIAATPLPASLPLLATGFAALGLLGWYKKRNNALRS